MKSRKIIAALLMLGITALGAVYLINKTPPNISQPVDTNITFPLNDKN